MLGQCIFNVLVCAIQLENSTFALNTYIYVAKLAFCMAQTTTLDFTSLLNVIKSLFTLILNKFHNIFFSL
jgi:hypothetical protein